ncbi:chondroitin sulfate synthase 1 [Macrosteles quadrilineatus]|uniref:chondroitin sulfate synthase 1 n=1 Tax=Macrosteles quadrilineatus TaxID=74068 RepID=UPI0023E2658F|nr:chondroitin sulfate synthase 1 [Macrosteles quadrilineatus]
MSRRRRMLQPLLGLVMGLTAGLLLSSVGDQETCPGATRARPAVEEAAASIVGLEPTAYPNNSHGSLLFVGVMTAEKYLSTRAVAVYETWGKSVPGKIAFFSSEVSKRPKNRPDLPLVSLKTVDDSYPPQKKSFMMLKYMWDNFGDRFEWFFRADDDVYVRTERLEVFLRSLDSRKPYFLGQAGRGNQEEFGLLSLEYDENFCMGGPGMILSRETLRRIAPHIGTCLGNLFTTHEDVEVGRCVQRFAGIPCTWAYDMVNVFYHNYTEKTAFTGPLKSKSVHDAITLHPIKLPKYMYRLHNYIQGLRVRDTLQQRLELFRDLVSTAQLLHQPVVGGNTRKTNCSTCLQDAALLGVELSLNQFRPKSSSNVLTWDFMSKSLFSHKNLNPRRRPERALYVGIEDAVREVMDLININADLKGREIDFKELLYGYYRLNPLYGADYIFDLLLTYKKFRGHKMTVPVRKHVYLHQSFTAIDVRETFEMEDAQDVTPYAEIETEVNTEDLTGTGLRQPLESGFLKLGQTIDGTGLQAPTSLERRGFYDASDKLINFILPLSGRYNTFLRFVENFENVCLKRKEKVTLTVVLFPNERENSFNQSLSLVNQLQQKYAYTRLTVLPMNNTFARALALDYGASHVPEPDDLLFFIDVDMTFNAETLLRVRLNTVRGRRVYFPIVFSQYDPRIVYNTLESPNHFNISQDSGYWRQFGFGIASLYKTDLRKVGGFDTSIRGWGKEDVDLFDKLVAISDNVTVFRAVDPGLVHIFHVVQCDPNLTDSQLEMCKNTRASTYASQTHLAQLFCRDQQKYLTFLKRKKSGKR